MNRLERQQLLDRVASAEAKANSLESVVNELSARIAALENKPKLGGPPKATDGNAHPE